jgi:hypothetical protein
MDMIREILQVMEKQGEPITMRHIEFHTGFTRSTLVAIMMGMINQGYVTEVHHQENRTGKFTSCHCTDENCAALTQPSGRSSLDRRRYRICKKGERYLINWSTQEEK